jgi:hypothetical protein
MVQLTLPKLCQHQLIPTKIEDHCDLNAHTHKEMMVGRIIQV